MQPPFHGPRRRSVLAASAACWLLLAAGCGGDGIGRVEVSGKVTLDGQPLSEGAILFQPIAEGPSAGGTIQDGRFTIERADGPASEEYRVDIVAYRPTGRQIPDADFPGKMTDELKQVIPNRYNADTELTVNVSAEGNNHFEFKLQSD